MILKINRMPIIKTIKLNLYSKCYDKSFMIELLVSSHYE